MLSHFKGMHAVSNASSLFIDEGEDGGGGGSGPSVLGVSMLGNRPVCLEVQVGF